MKIMQRDLLGHPIQGVYPSAFCLLLVDAASIASTSHFNNLRVAVDRFANALTADRDFACLIRVALSYSGDIRSYQLVFGGPSTLKPMLPDEMRSTPLEAADLEAACELLLEKAWGERRGGSLEPACFLIVLTDKVVDFVSPVEITCLWASVDRSEEKSSGFRLSLTAEEVLREMKRRII